MILDFLTTWYWRQLRKAERDADRYHQARRAAYRDMNMRQIALGKGAWVKAEDMSPLCNIADRFYRTEGGDVSWYLCAGLEKRKIDAWFFPDEDDAT